MNTAEVLKKFTQFPLKMSALSIRAVFPVYLASVSCSRIKKIYIHLKTFCFLFNSAILHFKEIVHISLLFS